MRRRSPVLVMVMAVIAVLSATPAGGDDRQSDEEILAETSHVTIRKAGAWVYYEYTDALNGTQQRTYNGRRADGGGCSYSGRETVSPSAGTGITEEREVASNSETCVMVTQVGRRTAPEGYALGTQTEVERAVPAVAARAGAGVVPEAVTRSARHKTYYEDPPGIDVNSAETHVTWTYSGGA